MKEIRCETVGDLKEALSQFSDNDAIYHVNRLAVNVIYYQSEERPIISIE